MEARAERVAIAGECTAVVVIMLTSIIVVTSSALREKRRRVAAAAAESCRVALYEEEYPGLTMTKTFCLLCS